MWRGEESVDVRVESMAAHQSRQTKRQLSSEDKLSLVVKVLVTNGCDSSSEKSSSFATDLFFDLSFAILLNSFVFKPPFFLFSIPKLLREVTHLSIRFSRLLVRPSASLRISCFHFFHASIFLGWVVVVSALSSLGTA